MIMEQKTKFLPNLQIYRDTFLTEEEVMNRKYRLLLSQNENGVEIEKVVALVDEKEKEEKKSAYKTFWQLNDAMYETLVILGFKSNGTYLDVLLFIVHNVDNYNSFISSNKNMAYVLNYSIKTIERAMKFLSDHNYIKRYRSGNERIIVVNPRLVFRSYGKNQKYVDYDNEDILIDEIDQRLINERRNRLNEFQINTQKKSAKKLPILVKRNPHLK